jgi:Swt1-like HEPN
MAVTNHERVGRALALLAEGLAPFVTRECKARYGDQWVRRVARNERVNPNDAQFLLAVLADAWREFSPRRLAAPNGTT